MDSFLQTWNDPAARHAMLVHLPIVFGLLGVLPLLGLAAYRFNCKPMAGACVLWFALASAGAALAANAGEAAEEKAEDAAALSDAAEALLHDHEELGEGGWMWPLIPGGLALLTLVPRKPVRLIAGVLAIAASLGVAVWIGATAQAGGKLVYQYGVGVPDRATATAADGVRPIGPEEGEHEEAEDDD